MDLVRQCVRSRDVVGCSAKFIDHWRECTLCPATGHRSPVASGVGAAECQQRLVILPSLSRFLSLFTDAPTVHSPLGLENLG